ncbi:MAG: hypothetical protein OHK0023_03730 [Anaerolineae bacterium]
MAFLNNLGNRLSLTEAGLAAAIVTLRQDGDLTDLEKRIISIFRDQFSPLSSLDNTEYETNLQRAMSVANNVAGNVTNFVNTSIAPSVTQPQHRTELYRYCYALSMADLIVDDGETAMLSALATGLSVPSDAAHQAENDVLIEFHGLHRALAATVIGLIVVTADGRVEQSELDNVRNARAVLEPIAHMDDLQFGLVFDLSLNIHDRFLLDPTNRSAFLTNLVSQLLNTHELGLQAFEYAASVATADGDISQAELGMLKSLLEGLHIQDSDGEEIFNRYFARVQTIDGKPR